MTVELSDFLQRIILNPTLAITVLLTLGVVFVNGWTDAPNAIATCVSTRTLHPQDAIFMSAIFNFLGVLVMTLFNTKVVQTIYNMVYFGDNSKDALVSLCSALFSIILWATVAWWFGIPTSESHALIAGITGAAIAVQGGLNAVNTNEWIKVIYGLALSILLSFPLGWIISKIVEFAFRRVSLKETSTIFNYAQIFGGAGLSFMHGAQDGQKFMGVFLLGIYLSQGRTDVAQLFIPAWLILLCSLVMAAGTSIGGYRIIKAVGIDMVKLKKYQGFSADLAAVISLFTASMFGLPVSTTHVKTTAIMGVGVTKSLSKVKWGFVRGVISAWLLTFPFCGIIGYLMAKIFMKLF